MNQPLQRRTRNHLYWPLTLLALGACHGSTHDAPPTGGIAPGAAGQGRYASFLDMDQSGSVTAGDALLMRFNQALVLGPGANAAFQLRAGGDELGESPQVSLESNPAVVRITLGAGAHLRARGFHDGNFETNSPSGLHVSPSAPPGALVSAANQLDALRGGMAIDLAPGFSPGDTGDAATYVLCHDMDCDGLEDLIWASDGKYGGIRVELQQSTGEFVLVNTVALDGILGMQAGDFDSDGRPDLAILLDDNSVRMLRNQGIPGEVSLLDQAFLSTAGLGQPQAVELTDLNGDGLLDVVIGTDLHLLSALGLGLGGFEDPSPMDAPDGNFGCVDSADFNSDGRMDLVACSTQGDYVLLYGDFGQLLQGVVRIGAEQTHAVAVGDLDSDGRLDLVLATDMSVLLWRQAGPQGFDPNGQEALLAANATRDLQLADIDGDSKLDLILLDSQSLELRIGDGLGSFSRSPLRSALNHSSGRGLALADLDNDGDLDIFCAAEKQQLWWGSAAGTFGSTTYGESAQGPPDADQFPGVGPTYHIVHADFDGDGDMDAATAGNGAVRLWRNVGAGSMELHQVLLIQQDRAQKLAFADFNLDGHLDLVAAAVGVSNHLWLAVSPGVYPNASMPLLAGAQGSSIAAGDLDNDGDIDLVLGTIRTHSDRILLNGGLTSGEAPAGGGALEWAGFDGELSFLNNRQTNHIALADMDCDGDLDILMAQGPAAASTVWRNYLDGASFGFAQVLNLPISIDQTATVQAGDVDQDGFMDILFGHRGGATVHYGTGTLADGGFTRTHVFSQGALTYAELLDINADGHLDVFFALSQAASIQLHLGSSLGFSGTPDQVLPESGVRSISFGDCDGDGDADLYVGRFLLEAANGIYLNQ